MIVIITLVLIGTITALLRLPGVEDFDKFDVTILPMFNAIFNLFSFGFLSCALVAILRRNVKVHRRFIYAALVSMTLFLVNFVFFLVPVICAILIFKKKCKSTSEIYLCCVGFNYFISC